MCYTIVIELSLQAMSGQKIGNDVLKALTQESVYPALICLLVPSYPEKRKDTCPSACAFPSQTLPVVYFPERKQKSDIAACAPASTARKATRPLSKIVTITAYFRWIEIERHKPRTGLQIAHVASRA